MATAEGDVGPEAPIAAFVVAKGGLVLKHIFLNAPPPAEDEAPRGGDGDREAAVVEEEDPPVLFGRHPSCHVLVDHPSVSRRHLEVRCKRRQRRITVTDLSSVHGSWVSGQRIPPNTPVDLAVGDALRLGSSKREYRLHWLSLREAIEMEDLLPPLHEEELCTHGEENKQLVPGHWESVDTEIYQETIQQVASEQIESWAEVIPSAPPLPEFLHSFSMEENMVYDNPTTEFVGSSIIQAVPPTVIKDGTPVQSDKWDASSTMPRKTKLKSVKSLSIDTGRSKERSSTLRFSYRKEEAENENLVCSQNCGRECAACMVLLDNSVVKETEEKQKVIPPPNNDRTNPLESKEFVHSVSPLHLVEHGTFPEKENYMQNIATKTEQHDLLSENSVAQDPVDAKLLKRPELLPSVSPLVFKDDTFSNKISQLGACIHVESFEPVPENPFMQDTVGENVTSPEYMDGSLSNKENMSRNKILVGPEDCELVGTICGNLFGSLETEETEDISQLDKENITPCFSGNIVTERSRLILKPTISQELMDSISPLNLEHDNSPDNENSMLNIGKQMKSNELISQNLIPLISVDAKLQRSQTKFMPNPDLDSENGMFPDKENSVLAPGKYDAIFPVRQADLFSDKENVTPASRDLKHIGRQILGSKMDTPVSTECTPNKNITKRGCHELSAKSIGCHTVDDESFYSDKENLTPMSSVGMKARRCLPKNLFPVDAEQDQEVFYSDKENSTPAYSAAQKTKDMSENTQAFYSDKENSTPASSAAQKTRDVSENRARIESAITKKRVVERVPFQTLLSNSPLRPPGSSLDFNQADARATNVAIKLEDKLNNLAHKNQESDMVREGMKIWTMVTDTDSLLDDESRKSIMLLKGIKGTHLIIPSIVMRELDCMKRREGLFRRSSKATSILQWIKECMDNESWWIHVQSTSEMLPVPPTPPATPTVTQHNDEEIDTFNPVMVFLSPRSFTDIVSPRTEDRVLDCALLFSKLRGNQNMVVLSNRITLKIKAMAEGLLCEGAKEFRESLMNPCSGRFMWATSVPRGSAWSCLDEVTLAENYYNSHHHEARRRVPRPVEAAKGLKLILLHNSSLYAQATNSVVKQTPLSPTLTSR